ncbi:MAG: metallophosphoesterase [Bacteroidetes bacterium]|nr:MAG: metallophosphoesterase [Bacteroidota bacterium]
MPYRKINFLLSFFLLLLWASCSQYHDKSLKFAFLTDLHVVPGGESSWQLIEIVEEINASQLQFVIIAGDISNHGSDEELNHVNSILGQLQVPWYILPGNHETNWSESAGRTFAEIWGDDKFLFRKDNVLFAGLNTGPFMRMGDGHVKQEDIRWLSRQLKANIKPETRLLFFAHYPLAEGLDQWYKITDILNEYEPVVAFCGHGHRQQLLNFDGIPGIMGRSMVLRGENIPGYNVIELRNDSIFVFEKLTGENIQSPNIAFDIRDPAIINNLPITPRPDYSINDQYPFVETVFQFQDTASVFTGPLIWADSLVVFGNSEGILQALNIRTKETEWSLQLEGPLFANPVTSKNIIITGDTDGFLYGIEPESGEIIWKHDADAPIVSPALLDGDYFYVGTGNKSFMKFEIKSGNPVWSFNEVSGLIQARAAIHENYLVFTAWDTHVYCLDKNTGRLIWKWNNGHPAALLSPGNVVPVIRNNKVFIVAPDRYMTALDLETGKEIWRSNKHQVRESMGVSNDGDLIFAKLMNDSIIAVCAKAAELKTIWIKDAGFGYDHNPCPIVSTDEALFAATRNGLVMALEPATGKLLWEHKTGNTAINFMIPVNEKLWLTTTDGKILALSI